MERIADVSATAKQDRGKPMPSRVRAALWVTLVMLLAGALYLYAVRGEAIMLDLGAIGRFLLCL